MPTIRIPGPLRKLTGNLEEIPVTGSTLATALDQDGVGIGYRGYYFRATKLDVLDLKSSLLKLL